MFHCERCGSKYHSARAATIDYCPRCLLRKDISSPLIPGPPRAKPAKAGGPLPTRIAREAGEEIGTETASRA